MFAKNKKVSITCRITCWYALFLLIISGGFIFFHHQFDKLEAEFAADTALSEAVNNAGEYILEKGDTIAMGSYLSFYKNGIYLSVYDKDGNIIEGRRPVQLSTWPGFKDNEIQKCRDNKNRQWYIFDSQLSLNDELIWIRGITKSEMIDRDLKEDLPFAMAGLFLLVIFAIAGGYLISKRALAPVRSLIETVHRVSNDERAEKHLPPAASGDELELLTDEFNQMFDRLGKEQEREKQFTSDVSHELKTPLAVILTQCEYAKDDPSYQEEALNVICRNATAMSELVSTLLFLSRGDAGKLSYEKNTVDLSDLYEMVVDQQKELLEQDDISLSASIEPDLFVEGDEVLLMQIPINLISNAHKYGKCPGGHIQVSLHKEEDHIVLTVKDDGPGIDEEDQKKIFDRFYTVNPSRTEVGSSGLGLSIVKMIAEFHEGTVSVESSKGQGSTFTVIFPEKGGHDEKK